MTLLNVRLDLFYYTHTRVVKLKYKILSYYITKFYTTFTLRNPILTKYAGETLSRRGKYAFCRF